MGRWIVTDWSILQPGYLDSDFQRGSPYTIAVWAPTYPMLSKIVLPALMNAIPDQLKIDYKKSDRELLVQGKRGKTLIHFMSGHEPERSRGLQLYRGWIDECALVSEHMFEEAQTRLSDRRGHLLLTSTPVGPNWLKWAVADVAADEPEEICFVSWRTIDNPYFPQDELEYKRRRMNPRYFKRTYEASFEAFEGMIFEEWNTRTHIVNRENVAIYIAQKDRWLGTPDDGKEQIRIERVVGGVDWGQTSPSAIVVVGVSSDGDYYILDEDQDIGVLPFGRGDTWGARAAELVKKWGISKFYADPNRPDNIAGWKKNHKLSIQAARDDVLAGLNVLMLYMHVDDELKRPRLFVYHAPKLVEEISTYQWAPVSKNSAMERPLKIKDHSIDALRYAIYNDIAFRFFREPNFRFQLPHDVQMKISDLRGERPPGRLRHV